MSPETAFLLGNLIMIFHLCNLYCSGGPQYGKNKDHFFCSKMSEPLWNYGSYLVENSHHSTANSAQNARGIMNNRTPTV